MIQNDIFHTDLLTSRSLLFNVKGGVGVALSDIVSYKASFRGDPRNGEKDITLPSSFVGGKRSLKLFHKVCWLNVRVSVAGS